MVRKHTGARFSSNYETGSDLQLFQQADDNPLPPATELAKIKEISPQLLEETIVMIKEQNQFRRKEIERQTHHIFLERMTALWVVVGLTLVAFASSIFLAMYNHEQTASVISGGTLVLVIFCIFRRR